MTKDFALFCHTASYRSGNSGYSEPLGKEQACVYEDGVRYIYSAPPCATRSEFKSSMRGFGRWVRKTFGKTDKKIIGSFPSYWVE